MIIIIIYYHYPLHRSLFHHSLLAIIYATAKERYEHGVQNVIDRRDRLACVLLTR